MSPVRQAGSYGTPECRVRYTPPRGWPLFPGDRSEPRFIRHAPEDSSGTASFPHGETVSSPVCPSGGGTRASIKAGRKTGITPAGKARGLVNESQAYTRGSPPCSSQAHRPFLLSCRPRLWMVPACSLRSRTLRAASGGGLTAILDLRCARWPGSWAVGTEERSLIEQRNVTKGCGGGRRRVLPMAVSAFASPRRTPCPRGLKRFRRQRVAALEIAVVEAAPEPAHALLR